MDPHERLGPNQSAKIEAECLTTAQSTAKMQVRSGSKSLSVYYDWKMYNEAILEFNKSKFYYMSKNNKSYEDIKLLAQTHYNLAITYSKLGMFKTALSDANYAFNLIPNKEYREIIGSVPIIVES